MKPEKRFEIVYEYDANFAERTRILRDRVTGVCYLQQWSGAGGGITVLVDREGKPIVMEEGSSN